MFQASAKTIALLTLLSLFILFSSACGQSDDKQVNWQDIPRYPDAKKGETIDHSVMGGFLGGNLEQYTTTNSFEDVVTFYTDALSAYDTELLSHTSELGQQTIISMPKKNGIISVAIQEFRDEGTVNITLMSVTN